MSAQKRASLVLLVLFYAAVLILAQGCTAKDKKSAPTVAAAPTATFLPEETPVAQTNAATILPETSPSGQTKTSGCDFSKPVALRAGTTYDFLGSDVFDTTVCGYISVPDELGGEGGNIPVTIPYLVILEYGQIQFQRSIASWIARGNNINRKEGDHYLFNCGCVKDGHIVGREYPDGVPYIDPVTEKALLGSSIEQPVTLMLSFGMHNGSGCVCCNTAHKIRLAQIA